MQHFKGICCPFLHFPVLRTNHSLELGDDCLDFIVPERNVQGGTYSAYERRWAFASLAFA